MPCTSRIRRWHYRGDHCLIELWIYADDVYVTPSITQMALLLSMVHARHHESI